MVVLRLDPDDACRTLQGQIRDASILAAEHMDWMQVVLNQAAPCFHVDSDGTFCGRAEFWHSDGPHKFLSLADLLRVVSK